MLLSGAVPSQNELGTHAGHRQSEAAEFAGCMVLAAGGRSCGVSAAGVVIPTQSRGALQRARPQLNREIMLMSTAYDLAISASVSPAARRLIASLRWYSDSLGLRPNLTPFAIARFRPSPVRSLIKSRSNSAIAASNVESKRPCDDDVSHKGSPIDRNAAPALLIRSIRSNSSRVLRPKRSNFVTSTTSPALSEAINLASCGRSARAPLIFSR